VEVGRRMVVVQHVNDDSEKTAYLRHASSMRAKCRPLVTAFAPVRAGKCNAGPEPLCVAIEPVGPFNARPRYAHSREVGLVGHLGK
jgi:hypothetical protein